MTQVRETKAGKSIAAYIVLNKKGDLVAKVQAHFSDGGTCTVDVWNIGDAVTRRTAIARGYEIGEDGRIAKGHHKGEYPYTVAQQSGRAGGYGYDKFTAALSGLVIDGHTMSDHCGVALKPPKGRKTWPRDAKAPKGYTFANYIDGAATYQDGTRKYNDIPEDESGYSSCFKLDGLKYLDAMGYRVIQAI